MGQQGDRAKWKDVLEGLSETDARFLLAVISRMLLHNACGLERRVVKPLQGFPFKLLWFAFKPMGERCRRRRSLAQELLDTDNSKLEINARKIKSRFLLQLRDTAKDGCVDACLFWIFRSVGKIWKSDVRENERLNKMVGLLDDRCPQIGMELKSARVGIKYKLGAAGSDVSGASSNMKHKVQIVRDQCLESWDDILDIMSNPLRWSPSTRPESIPTQAEVKADFPKLKPVSWFIV